MIPTRQPQTSRPSGSSQRSAAQTHTQAHNQTRPYSNRPSSSTQPWAPRYTTQGNSWAFPRPDTRNDEEIARRLQAEESDQAVGTPSRAAREAQVKADHDFAMKIMSEEENEARNAPLSAQRQQPVQPPTSAGSSQQTHAPSTQSPTNHGHIGSAHTGHARYEHAHTRQTPAGHTHTNPLTSHTNASAQVGPSRGTTPSVNANTNARHTHFAHRAPATMANTSSATAQTSEGPQCVVCMGSTTPRKSIQRQCGHRVCDGCILSVFTEVSKNRELFPPKCCKEIELNEVRHFLSSELAKTYEAKRIEYTTPNPTYCHVKTCSAFLPPSVIWAEYKVGQCPEKGCAQWTCTMCKQRSHGWHPCPEDEGLRLTKNLARESGWRHCPRCNELISRKYGCNQMQCRCGYQFCWLCKAQFGTCGCAIEDHNMREATAEQRVEEMQSVRRGDERVGIHNNADYLENEAVAWRIQRREERWQAMRDWEDMHAFPRPSRRRFAHHGTVYRGGHPTGRNVYY